MIRLLIGFLLVFGVVGGVEHMPPEPTFSYVGWLVVLFFAGLSLMLSGLSKLKG
jgi:hypothetical protein